MAMKKIVLLMCLVIFFSLSFLGYWLLIRPSLIRGDCYNVTKARNDEPGEQGGSYLNNVYRACLASHGLKPEDLIN